MSKTILISGFQPFGGERVNASLEAVRRLPDEIGGVRLVKMELPVVFGKAAELLLEQIRAIGPDAALAVGQAGGRKAITPELIAVNVQNGRLPDNEGNQPDWTPILADGPAGIFSRLPVHEMVRAMEEAGIRAELSLSAGAFVCNELMYRVLAATADSALPFGFLHVPCLPEQTADKPGVPSVPLEEIVRALELCICIFDD
ncbi:MAG: pyroglutamyl-peptidase I [Clostridia bacterium]